MCLHVLGNWTVWFLCLFLLSLKVLPGDSDVLGSSWHRSSSTALQPWRVIRLYSARRRDTRAVTPPSNPLSYDLIAQHTDWYLRWRQSLSLDVSAVMICASVAFCGGGQGGGGGVASLLTAQITYYLMWFSQAGRLLFSTSFVFSVEVHLINVVLCQGPAHRLAGSP